MNIQRPIRKTLTDNTQELPPTYDVIKTQNLTSAVRLGFYADGSEQMDEAVLRFQGIVYNLDLPPVKKMNRSVVRTSSPMNLTSSFPRIDDNTGRYLSQSIAVSGFGGPSFAQAYKGMFVIAEHLGRHLPDKATVVCKDHKYHGQDAIRSSNRYLTFKAAAGTLPSLPFSNHVDPFQTLQQIAGEKYVHTEENHVEYLACCTTDSGKVS